MNAERSDSTNIGDVLADAISVELDPIPRALSEETLSAFREGREPQAEDDLSAEFPGQEVTEWTERREEARQNELREKKLAWENRQIGRALRAAQIPTRYHQSFDDLDRAHNPQAFTACKELAETGKYEGKLGLILSGDPGNGKTTLAAAAMQNYIQRTKGRFPAKFWPINQSLQRTQDSFGEADSEPLSDLYDCYLLVLDDLGKRRLTPWASDVLFGVVDSLYGDKRRLIITTNWTADEMFQELEGSLVSRIYEMCHEVILNSHDHRLER